MTLPTYDTLIKDGYISFNLKDYSEDLYNNLRAAIPYQTQVDTLNPHLCSFFLCAHFENLSVSDFFNKFESMMDGEELYLESNDYLAHKNKAIDKSSVGNANYIEMSFLFNNFEILKKVKNTIFSNFDFKQDQSWFHTSPFRPNEHSPQIYSTIHTILQNVIQFYYPEDISNYFHKDNYSATLTAFPNGSLIQPHKDGENSDRLAVILIYLNDNWKSEYGGQIVLEKDKIVEPEFGNIALLDFTNNNIHHEVLRVNTEDMLRYAIVSFLDIRNY